MKNSWHWFLLMAAIAFLISVLTARAQTSVPTERCFLDVKQSNLGKIICSVKDQSRLPEITPNLRVRRAFDALNEDAVDRQRWLRREPAWPN